MIRLAILFLFYFCSLPAYTNTYRSELVLQDLGIPWSIEFISEKKLLINEKHGTVSLFDIDTGKRRELITFAEVDDSGQGGLLDVSHVKSQTGEIQLFFSYSKTTPEGANLVIATAELNDDKITGLRDLFVANAVSDSSRHFGSRLIVNDKYLFVTVGDRGERSNGQDINTHAGTILRLNFDGTAPEDNPFVGREGLDEIWTYGHRNPQGLFYDQESNVLWSIEHGPRGGDEINRIEKGKNYGWARVSQGKEYWGPLKVGEAESLIGMQDPELVYTPSIAPSNIILYRGSQYPNLDGKLIAGALKLTHLNVVEITPSGLKEYARLFDDDNHRIRDITLHPSGTIYFSTDSGKIHRLVTN
ncbi:PQQ-dependent sugar dehydrogenase [Vibrio sp. FNV 38]|nr:PQQ-dependent sugar dehydrogenase [Vibrio sp. FNV 38]